ncbi:MAG: ABC transporter permease [Clostridia bacterium]|nr:ABC transporter permease [Clostridia bacterium]
MKNLIKRVLSFVLCIFVLSVVVFTMSRLAPTDPLQSYYGDRTEKMSVQEKEEAREKLGLNDSIPTQYVRWIKSALQGDFGISYKYKQDVTEVISKRAMNTVILGGLGFVLTFLGALLLGVICAVFEDRLFDKLLCRFGTLLSCIPEFWLSLILIFVFAVMLKILPSGGAYSIRHEKDVTDRIEHLILPLTVVVFSHLWYYAYLIRNRILEEFREDYVRLAKAKGLGKGKIIISHCLRNIMPTYISLMAISVSHILGGTYIVEMVFSYPGLGTLSYESARYSDYNLLMLLCLMSGAVVMLCSSLGRFVSEKLDPRIISDRNTTVLPGEVGE